jgi:hypothetical protein
MTSQRNVDSKRLDRGEADRQSRDGGRLRRLFAFQGVARSAARGPLIASGRNGDFFKFTITDYHLLPFLKNNPKAGRSNWPLHFRGAFRPPSGRGTIRYPSTRPIDGPDG